jgi:hypothetical protein
MPKWIFQAEAAQSARALDALLPSFEGTIRRPDLVAASASRAKPLIKKGLLSASCLCGCCQRSGHDKSYERKTHTILPVTLRAGPMMLPSDHERNVAA